MGQVAGLEIEVLRDVGFRAQWLRVWGVGLLPIPTTVLVGPMMHSMIGLISRTCHKPRLRWLRVDLPSRILNPSFVFLSLKNPSC